MVGGDAELEGRLCHRRRRGIVVLRLTPRLLPRRELGGEQRGALDDLGALLEGEGAVNVKGGGIVVVQGAAHGGDTVEEGGDNGSVHCILDQNSVNQNLNHNDGGPPLLVRQRSINCSRCGWPRYHRLPPLW